MSSSTPDPARDTPPPPENPPGRSALDYRVTDYPRSRERLLARLATEEIPAGPNQGRRPLAQLATRDDDDPTIALVDAWAVVCDVLSFYQERIANEHYLRTARERRSVLELARMVGYELSPGVAAEAFLAFTVDDAPGSPAAVRVAAGTRVQSIPGQDELPQSFETSAEIIARRSFNALRPRQRQPQDLQAPERLYLAGVATRLSPGDLLLLVVERDGTPPDTAVVRARQVAADSALGLTRVELEAPPAYTNLSGRLAGTGTAFLSEAATGWEVEAAGQRRRVQSVESATELHVEAPFRPPLPPGSELSLVGAGTIGSSAGNSQVGGVGTNFAAQAHAGQQLAAAGQLRRVTSVGSATTLFVDQPFDPPLAGAAYTLVLAGQVSSLAPLIAGAPVRVFALRAKAAVFGHNAPNYAGLPDPESATVGDTLQGNPYPHDWDGPQGWSVWDDPLAGASPLGNLQIEEWPDADIYVEAGAAGLLAGSWSLLSSPRDGEHVYQVDQVNERSQTGFGLSAKVLGLDLARPGGARLAQGDPVAKPRSLRVRETTAYLVSQELALAERPLELPVPPESPDSQAGSSRSIVLDAPEERRHPGQALAIRGELHGRPGEKAAEVVLLRAVDRSDPLHPRLELRDDLRFRYARGTATLNANVALASHGETVGEVAGSGDTRLADQRMRLRQPPLTFVSAPNARGIESTLEVRVDEVLWLEAPSRAELGPDDRSYLLRIDDQDRATLIFGDGKRGARLPTGLENVQAIYRRGIGREGNVPAGKLSLLATRPLGIREVTNPVAASGGVPREDIEQARVNAPAIARTRGRIVSLRDFADFARAFTGVSKVFATALRGVHLSLAGEGGALFEPGTALFANLAAAIEAARLPGPRALLASYEPLFFKVVANLVIDPRRQGASVLRQAAAALAAEFSFARRDFAQPVLASQVLALLQQVEGVVAVDLDALHLSSEPPAFNTTLLARATRLEGQRIRPAQMLLLDPQGAVLREVRG
jgi:hypothetical protein